MVICEKLLDDRNSKDIAAVCNAMSTNAMSTTTMNLPHVYAVPDLDINSLLFFIVRWNSMKLPKLFNKLKLF